MVLSKIVSRVGLLVGISCTVHCLFEYVCDFVICSGESMQPTLNTNDILICNKTAQRFNSYNRNDIVIAVHPSQPKNLICKRLIALEGDVVLMNAPTDLIESEGSSSMKTIYIKPGSCWLEGDNRLNSTDSRNYGQIPKGLIKSKVLARIWPPNEFRIF